MERSDLDTLVTAICSTKENATECRSPLRFIINRKTNEIWKKSQHPRLRWSTGSGQSEQQKREGKEASLSLVFQESKVIDNFGLPWPMADPCQQLTIDNTFHPPLRKKPKITSTRKRSINKTTPLPNVITRSRRSQQNYSSLSKDKGNEEGTVEKDVEEKEEDKPFSAIREWMKKMGIEPDMVGFDLDTGAVREFDYEKERRLNHSERQKENGRIKATVEMRTCKKTNTSLNVNKNKNDVSPPSQKAVSEAPPTSHVPMVSKQIVKEPPTIEDFEKSLFSVKRQLPSMIGSGVQQAPPTLFDEATPTVVSNAVDKVPLTPTDVSSGTPPSFIPSSNSLIVKQEVMSPTTTVKDELSID